MSSAVTGPAIFGPRHRWCYYLSCLWSWPLLAHCLSGGVLGMCALPHCFVATIWWRSHLEILAAFYVTRYGAVWLGWGYDRPLALVVAALYLFLRGSAFPQTKGPISSCLPPCHFGSSEAHERAAVATEKQLSLHCSTYIHSTAISAHKLHCAPRKM